MHLSIDYCICDCVVGGIKRSVQLKEKKMVEILLIAIGVMVMTPMVLCAGAASYDLLQDVISYMR